MRSCKETSRLLAQDELGASRFERIGVRVHLLMCRFCRRYKAQLGALGAACREGVETGDEDPAVLAQLERSILERHRS